MTEYTKARITVRDIHGTRHIGEWAEQERGFSSGDVRKILLQTEGPVVIRQGDGLRVFTQYAYFDMELA